MDSLLAKIVFMSKLLGSRKKVRDKDLEDIKKVRRFPMIFRVSDRMNGIGSFDRTLTKPFIQFIFFKIFFFSFLSIECSMYKVTK